MTKPIRKLICFMAVAYAPMSLWHMLFIPSAYQRTFITPSFAGLFLGGILVAFGVARHSIWAWWAGFIVAVLQLYSQLEEVFNNFDKAVHFSFQPFWLNTIWLIVFVSLLLSPSICRDLAK